MGHPRSTPVGSAVCGNTSCLLVHAASKLNPYLDLQEGICDAADVMLWGEATHEQTAHDVAQLRHMPTIRLNGGRVHRADLHHERHPRQQHAVMPVQQQLGCHVLEGLYGVRHLPDHPAPGTILYCIYPFGKSPPSM